MWDSSQAENSWGQRLRKQATLSSSRELPRPGNRILGILGGKGGHYLVLVAKAQGIIQTRGGAGRACTGHVLSYPRKLHGAQVVELVQLNRGLQLQTPGGQTSLQGLQPKWRQKR